MERSRLSVWATPHTPFSFSLSFLPSLLASTIIGIMAVIYISIRCAMPIVPRFPRWILLTCATDFRYFSDRPESLHHQNLYTNRQFLLSL